jgi:hypothetical protein
VSPDALFLDGLLERINLPSRYCGLKFNRSGDPFGRQKRIVDQAGVLLLLLIQLPRTEEQER